MIKKLKAIYRRLEFYLTDYRIKKKFKRINAPFIKYNYIKHKNKTPNILWIGANLNQDNIGFIKELKSISKLTIFKNHINLEQVYFNRKEVEFSRNSNARVLIEFLQKNHFDFILGQLWPDLINLDYLNLQELIKTQGIKTICICMDDFMPERWQINQTKRFNGPAGFGNLVDLYATSHLYSILRYYKLGLKAAYLPFGCSESLNLNLERDIDISFIGSNYGIRNDILKYLDKNGLKVNAYGPGFSSGTLNSDEVINIYNRSKIVIGISQVGYQKDEINLKTRDFDVISSGALYISNSCEELNAFFTPGLHYIRYNSKKDLLDKAIYYLKNKPEREIISKRAQKLGLSHFLWRNNLKLILDTL